MPLRLYPSSIPDVEERSQISTTPPSFVVREPAPRNVGEDYEDNNGAIDRMLHMAQGYEYSIRGMPPMLLHHEILGGIEVSEGVSLETGADNGAELIQYLSVPANLQRSESNRNLVGSPRNRTPAAQIFIPAAPATVSMDPTEYLGHGPTMEFQRLSRAYLCKLHDFSQRIIQHWRAHCTNARFQPYFRSQVTDLTLAACVLERPQTMSSVEQRRDALRKFFCFLVIFEHNISHGISCAFKPEYQDFCLELAKGKEMVGVRFEEFNLWCEIIKCHTGETYTEIASYDTSRVERIDTLRGPVSGSRSRIPRPTAASSIALRERERQGARSTVITRREITHGIPARVGTSAWERSDIPRTYHVVLHSQPETGARNGVTNISDYESDGEPNFVLGYLLRWIAVLNAADDVDSNAADDGYESTTPTSPVTRAERIIFEAAIARIINYEANEELRRA